MRRTPNASRGSMRAESPRSQVEEETEAEAEEDSEDSWILLDEIADVVKFGGVLGLAGGDEFPDGRILHEFHAAISIKRVQALVTEMGYGIDVGALPHEVHLKNAVGCHLDGLPITAVEVSGRLDNARIEQVAGANVWVFRRRGRRQQ